MLVRFLFEVSHLLFGFCGYGVLVFMPSQPSMGLLFVELLMCVVFEKDSYSVQALLIIETTCISV